MTDRKTVMSWLEGLTWDDWHEYHSDSEVQNIAKATLELLKAQEPAKPRRDRGYMVYNCPECGTYLLFHQKYCNECGRELDWNAE